ncbi:hypothetical protein RB593_002184 [Gaeumannomyces tritici]
MAEPQPAPSRSGQPQDSHSQSQGRGRSRRGPRRGRGGAAEPADGHTANATPAAEPAAAAGCASSRGGGSRGNQRGDSRGGRRGQPRRGRGGRGGQAPVSVVSQQRTFGGHLTAPSDRPDSRASQAASGLSGEAPEFVPGGPVRQRGQGPAGRPSERRSLPKGVKSSAPDLPTRIHEDIDNREYECVICTNEVLRNSRVWSCSLCWTVVHLSCVKKWHSNQLSARDPQQESTTWRCPACNSSLSEDPGSYHCWCGKDLNPSPVPGLPPHSCGNTCSKPRPNCVHPCGLQCHSGPCPPCALMGPSRSCFCGKHEISKRCVETDYSKGWTCQEVCGDLLPCGEHTCARPCHDGLCGSCELLVTSTCYCGQTNKDIPCERREDILPSFDHGQVQRGQGSEPGTWFEGSFKCSSKCGRQFDCGLHTCQRGCHEQNQDAAHCPFSPDVVLTCPCGQTSLDDIISQPRQSCHDPIPQCTKVCGKTLLCSHSCKQTCHPEACEPCTQVVEAPCRCGRTATELICSEGQEEQPVCERTCRAQLNCGRHECKNICCTGERRASERLVAKRKNKASSSSSSNEEVEAEHVCIRVCGRKLKCGTHACQQLCHKGSCPSCLEAIFDEIACYCGRTVLYPPQPCGTRPPVCRFECSRAKACGHPAVRHNCHTDDVPCPPCPFLVEKPCICGKQTLKNQPCWFEEARCGLPCGSTLKCGSHKCQRLCHRPGQCEDAEVAGSHCSQPCGKTRTSCEHTCANQCHAPFPCKEDKPCQSKLFITCDCQNRKQEVRCLATANDERPGREALKCDEECLKLQRNRRLADALKIDPESHTDDHIPYSDATVKMFRENVGWTQTQEREFRVFAADPSEKRIRFKPMQPHQRAFLHSLAEDFGLDSESQDPEPHRHVVVFKTPRFVSAPRKTLAQCVNIIKTAEAASAAAAAPQTTRAASIEPFNAFVLSKPKFGLTIDEVDKGLAADLASTVSSSLTFTTTFLPASDEVLVTAHRSPVTAASIARAGGAISTPVALENALVALRPAIAKTVGRLGLAARVGLCHVDGSGVVGRREGGSSSSGPDADGWSAVVGRAAGRQPVRPAPEPAKKPGGVFLALARRKPAEPPKPKPEPEPLEDDWETAAEKLEDRNSG